MIRCLECGDEINPSDEFITEEGDYLCKRCMWKYQDLAYRMMVKSFEQLPPLYRKAFATPNMPALGDFCKYVEDYTCVGLMFFVKTAFKGEDNE